MKSNIYKAFLTLILIFSAWTLYKISNHVEDIQMILQEEDSPTIDVEGQLF